MDVVIRMELPMAGVCECMRCHSRAPLGALSDIWGTAEEAKEEAVRRWNRRVKT